MKQYWQPDKPTGGVVNPHTERKSSRQAGQYEPLLRGGEGASKRLAIAVRSGNGNGAHQAAPFLR